MFLNKSADTRAVRPQVGDKIYLKSILANLHLYGVISDGDTPDQISAALEVHGSNGTLSLAALMGPQGPAGKAAPILKLQNDIINNPDDLPGNLTDDPVDIGKYWIIEERDSIGNIVGSKAHLWHGDRWQVFQMGTQGPAGPVPIITPNVELLNPDDPKLDSYITVTGTDELPNWTLHLKAPRGPRGPATSIAAAPDVDGTIEPEEGDVLSFDAKKQKWQPTRASSVGPRFYTMPESMFTSVGGLQASLSIPIGSYAIPPQEWDWTPIVFGHLRVVGVEFDADPMIIGVEVRLGDATNGQVVARGWGNSNTWTTLVPHFSSAKTPSDAAVPGNGRGVVRAGHTGTAGTLYVRILNNGALGLPGAYSFNNAGAQLSIQVQPV